MNRTLKTIAILSLVVLTAACSKVPAGNVGVKFDLYGGDKGVTGEVVGPGKYWMGWNEEMYIFPTFTQNYVWTAGDDTGSPTDESISFQDRDGTVFNADIGISYSVRGDMADKVFEKYRRGVDEITDVYLRNMVRDALNSETSKMEGSVIYGNGKEELMNRVTERIRSQVAQLGLEVEKIYWIGAMRLPSNIVTAINLKIEATQKAQQRENELQTAAAQAEIDRTKAQGEADAVLINAKAQAEANRLLAQSVTQTLVDYKALERWNGQLPTTTGGVVPFLNIQR